MSEEMNTSEKKELLLARLDAVDALDAKAEHQTIRTYETEPFPATVIPIASPKPAALDAEGQT